MGLSLRGVGEAPALIFLQACAGCDSDTPYYCISLELSLVTRRKRSVERFRSRPRLGISPAGKICLCPTKTIAAGKVVCLLYNYFLSLCGLWLGQALLLHRSGMVFVPSIISEPQRSQIRPVGFASIAFLHSG